MSSKTHDRAALNARLRPDPDALRSSFEIHRAEADISVEEHIRRLCLALGKSLGQRRAVYLDTRYWIFLRDAVLGNPQKPVHIEALSELRHKVKTGRVFCPLSSAIFFELLKQTRPESRRASAALVDELSLGVALCDEHERISTEIYFLLSKGHASIALPPIRSTVWVRLPYVLGVAYPTDTGFSREDERVIQKTFTDHFWTRSLTDIVMALDGNLPPGDYEPIAERLNASNATHADEVGDFRQTYLAEIGGSLELFAGIATDMIEARIRTDPANEVDLAASTRAEREKSAHKLLFNVARLGRGADAFPTLHAQAKCHAAIRRDKPRKLEGNDLMDFHHAIGAVAYCRAFFTEASLRTLLTSNPVALDREFGCKVISDEVEALQYLRGL
jgi:hypothetical protein